MNGKFTGQLWIKERDLLRFDPLTLGIILDSLTNKTTGPRRHFVVPIFKIKQICFGFESRYSLTSKKFETTVLLMNPTKKE